MTATPHTYRLAGQTARPLMSAAAAKSRLLAWADEHDAQASGTWSRTRTLVRGGLIAAVVGAVIGRIVLPGRRRTSTPSSFLVSTGRRVVALLFISRAAKSLIPLGLWMFRSKFKSRTAG